MLNDNTNLLKKIEENWKHERVDINVKQLTIDLKPESKEIGYIGHDGVTYNTVEELRRANANWLDQNCRKHNLEQKEPLYIGRDGKTYSTRKELQQANSEWMDKFCAKIQK